MFKKGDLVEFVGYSTISRMPLTHADSLIKGRLGVIVRIIDDLEDSNEVQFFTYPNLLHMEDSEIKKASNV